MGKFYSALLYCSSFLFCIRSYHSQLSTHQFNATVQQKKISNYWLREDSNILHQVRSSMQYATAWSQWRGEHPPHPRSCSEGPTQSGWVCHLWNCHLSCNLDLLPDLIHCLAVHAFMSSQLIKCSSQEKGRETCLWMLTLAYAVC